MGARGEWATSPAVKYAPDACGGTPVDATHADGGGLVGLAMQAVKALGSCHMAAESVAGAVLPPAPPAPAALGCGPGKPLDDLTSLLHDLNESAHDLYEKLAGLRSALLG